MTMRVLHITNLFPTERHPYYGVFVKEQIESLREEGIDCEVLYINIKENGVLQYFKEVPRIRAIENNFDIVHCHQAYTAFVSLYLSRLKKPSLISFLSVPQGESRVGFAGYLATKAVLVLNPYFIIKYNALLNEKTASRKRFYLPNGVNMSFFREINRLEAQKRIGLDNKKYILFVSGGGIERKCKRYDIFQKTISILNEKYKENVVELILTNKERDLVPFYFNSARLLILTSDFEGSPNVVKEMLACNLPVVSRDVGNAREILEGIEGCFITESDDPEQIALLARDALKYERVEGRAAILNKGLDSRSIAKKLITIYKTILNNRVR